jgi:hypothetical protein
MAFNSQPPSTVEELSHWCQEASSFLRQMLLDEIDSRDLALCARYVLGKFSHYLLALLPVDQARRLRFEPSTILMLGLQERLYFCLNALEQCIRVCSEHSASLEAGAAGGRAQPDQAETGSCTDGAAGPEHGEGTDAPSDQGGAGQSEEGGAAEKRSKTIPLAEANELARAYIRKQEQAGAKISARDLQDYIASTLGGSFALGRVPELPAWIAHQTRKATTPQDRQPKPPRQLTPEILAFIGQGDDPSAPLVDAEETTWRYLVESAKTPEERARLNTMSPAEKAEAIQLLLDQWANRDKRGKRQED